MARITTLAPALLLAVMLTACAAAPDPQVAAVNAKLPYPKAAALGKDLDIVLVQSRTAVTITNRTPHNYRDVQVWINQQFVARISTLEISESNSTRLGLNDFIDHHGDGYPVSSLMHPDNGYPVVLAELFDPSTGMRHRLLVRKD